MKQYARPALVAAGQKSELQSNVAGAQGISATTAYVAPDRCKTDVAVGPNALTAIVVGNDAYASRNGAPFVKTGLRPAMQAQVKGWPGTVYAAAAQTETLTCTYDKETYRLVKFANDEFAQTFESDDDLKNASDLLKDVK